MCNVPPPPTLVTIKLKAVDSVLDLMTVNNHEYSGHNIDDDSLRM